MPCSTGLFVGTPGRPVFFNNLLMGGRPDLILLPPHPAYWQKLAFLEGGGIMMGRFVRQGDLKPFSLFSNHPMPLAGTTKHENNQIVGDIFIKGLT
jgi:hypothetical protein